MDCLHIYLSVYFFICASLSACLPSLVCLPRERERGKRSGKREKGNRKSDLMYFGKKVAQTDVLTAHLHLGIMYLIRKLLKRKEGRRNTGVCGRAGRQAGG
jgi:hypothetical protein